VIYPTKSSKCCGTCAHWCGPRQAKMGQAVIQSADTRGKCTKGVNHAANGNQANSGFGCSKYQLWSAL